ncbi:MAG TPA: hypothetical protein PKY05_06355, partial [Fibrobacteria bacterium]|nr:hypothetical protein [Fibrobacteria bacterium]
MINPSSSDASSLTRTSAFSRSSMGTDAGSGTSDASGSGFASTESANPTGTSHLEGPLPLPTESPFLSDHGVSDEDIAHRPPAAMPSGLSQFPATSAPGMASAAYTAATKTQSVPRSNVNPGSSGAGLMRMEA